MVNGIGGGGLAGCFLFPDKIHPWSYVYIYIYMAFIIPTVIQHFEQRNFCSSFYARIAAI